MERPPHVHELSQCQWKILSSLPVPRHSDAAVASLDGNQAILVGGVVNKGGHQEEVTSSALIFDLNKDRYKSIRSMPTARRDCKAVWIDDNVYVLGGYDGEQTLRTVEVWSSDTDEWKELEPFQGTYTYDFNVVAVGRWIYIVGCEDSNSTGERFHVDTGLWDTYPSFERLADVASTAVAVGAKIYVTGGWDPLHQRFFGQMDVFDTVTQTWETPDTSDSKGTHRPRKYAQAVVLAERYMVVMGGVDEKDDFIAAVDIYDTQCNSWSSFLPNAPTPARWGHASVVLGGCRVLMMGAMAQRSIQALKSVKQLVLWQLQPLPKAISRAQQLFSDCASGDDLLGVGEAARALADTIALKDLKPPFTAGILGHWGSGKSFFVELVRQRLVEIQGYDLTDAQVEANFPYAGHIYLVKSSMCGHSPKEACGRA